MPLLALLAYGFATFLLGVIMGLFLFRRVFQGLVVKHEVNTLLQVRHILPTPPDDPADSWKLNG